MIKLSNDWRLLIRQTVRLYFAPITGAIRGIREEYRKIGEEENAARKAAQSKMGEHLAHG